MGEIPENGALMDWLFASGWPSIRYMAMQDLQGQTVKDSDVTRELHGIMLEGPVPAILAQQTPAGSWMGEKSYYTPKYTSTHWSMLLLAELRADGSDPRLLRGAGYMLDATAREVEHDLHSGKRGLACFWGNILRYTLHAGLERDSRISLIVERINIETTGASWSCFYNNGQPCVWGVARALWGLTKLPPDLKNSETQATIENGVEFLRDAGRLDKGDYPPSNRIHSLWGRLNTPLFYQADILFILGVLGELGRLKEPWLTPALSWLEARRDRSGRWKSSRPYGNRTYPFLNVRDEANRWVSLKATHILQQAGG